MKTVISASRRTDIPAFYLKWLVRHLKNGYIDVPNPFNRQQVKQVSLLPEDVAWMVLWSRNYGIFLKNERYFDAYRLFFHFTITPADRRLEPDMISPKQALYQLEALVKRYGPEVITWRYDPLVFYRQDRKNHINHEIMIFEEFTKTISQLGLTRCYLSVAHLYSKVLKRATKIKNFEFYQPTTADQFKVLSEMGDIASQYGMHLYSCSNDALLDVQRLQKGRCIDGTLLNGLGNDKVSERAVPSRTDCGCTVSIDIGDYLKTPCRYHCLYCYARK